MTFTDAVRRAAEFQGIVLFVSSERRNVFLDSVAARLHSMQATAGGVYSGFAISFGRRRKILAVHPGRQEALMGYVGDVLGLIDMDDASAPSVDALRTCATETHFVQ